MTDYLSSEYRSSRGEREKEELECHSEWVRVMWGSSLNQNRQFHALRLSLIVGLIDRDNFPDKMNLHLNRVIDHLNAFKFWLYESERSNEQDGWNAELYHAINS